MTEAEPLRVIVADDQAVIREGVALLLDLIDGVEVVGAARDGEEAVGLVATHEPDVALMDLRMPECDGVEATRRIRAEHPNTQVVVLTTFADDDSILAALQAGARGFLTKDAGIREIEQAVRAAATGQTLLAPEIQQRLLAAASEGALSRSPPAASDPASPDGSPAGVTAELPDSLTPREGEVLALISAGLSNRDIAERLVISEVTVKTHVNRIFAKTGSRDRAQAVGYAYRHGLVSPG